MICADEVTQDGTVSFAFTHASDYVVVVDRVVEEESGGVIEPVLTESTANAEEHDTDIISEENPKTGQERTHIVAYVMILIILVIAAIVIFLQWKREEKNG